MFELLIIASYSKSLLNRIQQGLKHHNVLAFSRLANSDAYLEYNENVLHGNTRLRIAQAQKIIPANKTFIAWVSAPFYLDYARNVIYDVDPAGIASPWAYIPQEVEYFILEYGGYAVRPISHYLNYLHFPGKHERHIAERCLIFLQSIGDLSQNADVLYNDGKIIVFKIKTVGSK